MKVLENPNNFHTISMEYMHICRSTQKTVAYIVEVYDAFFFIVEVYNVGYDYDPSLNIC